MATLAEIRARLQAQENKGQGNTGGGDRVIYPHWNIEEGQSCLLRFLPDADPKNTFFWVERAMIKLPFPAVKGSADKKPVQIQVPCMETWGETCPVLTEVRPWFKDKSLEEQGRRYWKKRSYLMQGFVRENPIDRDETPENPIRRFVISPQLYTLIKAALLDPELEEMPTHYERGLDFRIVKTSKGGYADYNTSKWSRKETPLTGVEMAAIEKHGLFNLADNLPKKPTAVELKVIQEMFEASVDGQMYDLERWGQYYKPYGLSNGDDETATSVATSTTKPAPAAEPVTESKQNPPWENSDPAEATAPVAAPKVSAQANDILAMIRNRQKNS
jgi:hypothetical protein